MCHLDEAPPCLLPSVLVTPPRTCLLSPCPALPALREPPSLPLPALPPFRPSPPSGHPCDAATPLRLQRENYVRRRGLGWAARGIAVVSSRHTQHAWAMFCGRSGAAGWPWQCGEESRDGEGGMRSLFFARGGRGWGGGGDCWGGMGRDRVAMRFQRKTGWSSGAWGL